MDDLEPVNVEAQAHRFAPSPLFSYVDGPD